jgi:hypothetical protein
LVIACLALIFVAALYVEMLCVAALGAYETAGPPSLTEVLAAGVFRSELFHEFKQ